MTKFNRRHYFADRQLDRYGPPLHVDPAPRRWPCAIAIALASAALYWVLR